MEPKRESGSWWDELTPKEWEYLRAYDQYGSQKAVARALGRSESAVDAALTRARIKMGATSIGQSMRMFGAWEAANGHGSPNLHIEQKVNRQSSLGKLYLGSVIVLFFAVVCGVYLVFHKSEKDSWLPIVDRQKDLNFSSFEDLVSRLIQLPNNGKGAERQVSSVVEKLSDYCWQAMWGSHEAQVITDVTHIAPAVRLGLEWDLRNDPDAAVHILGNAHRILCRIPAFTDWKDLLDVAKERASNRTAIEYGRLLCGIAFAHWADESGRGFRCAMAARSIFAASNDLWDEANAIRHAGLCVNPSLARESHYEEALKIYTGLRDDRGIAMTFLSLGEAGSFEYAIRAAEMFEELQNNSLLREALNQCLSSEIDLVQNKETAEGRERDLPWRKRLRRLLIDQASSDFAEHNGEDWLTLMAECIAIDSRMPAQKLEVQDLTSVMVTLADEGDTDSNLRQQLYGYYVKYCAAAAVTVPAAVTDKFSRYPKPWARRQGEQMSAREILQTLAPPSVWYRL